MLLTVKKIVQAVWRSWLFRILVLCGIALVLLYHYVAMPWLNRAISENYRQQTGHSLRHDPLIIQFRQCSIQLNNLKDSADLWQARSIYAHADCWQSLRQKTLILHQLRIDQLGVNAHQLDSGLWNFNDVIEHIQKNKPATPPTKVKTSLPVVVKQIELSNMRVNTNLLAFNNNMPLVVAPLNITLKHLDLRAQNPVDISLNGNLNQSVPFNMTSTLNLENLTGKLDINAKAIPFTWFDSLLKPHVAVDIISGEIETHNQITLMDGKPQKITASGKLTHLNLRPRAIDQDAVKWTSLEWNDAEINLPQKTIHLPVVKVTELDGQFIINKDRKTNLQAMLLKPAASMPNEQKTESIADDNTPWQFAIDKIIADNAAIGFRDETLTPSFLIIVQKFSGEINQISSNPETTTDIQFNGVVDGTAPVSVKGTAKLFLPKPQLAALLSFKHIDIGTFTPYSAEYAGWRIKKGLLSVDLAYHYENGKIVGKNHIEIDRLEFGEKVRSPHALDIPLRLGVALLTDEKGLTVLDAEVSGEPNDPKFNFAEIIWRAVRNTFKKIVASPFHLLGNLVNTKEDLGRVEFAAGEFQLTEATINKLTLLSEGLKKRPTMRLSIHGGYHQETDLQALKEEQVKSSLQKMGLTAEVIRAQDASWADAVATRYQSQGLANTTASPQQKFNELAAKEVVDINRLRQLAHERAQAVKQFLVLQMGIPNESLYLESDYSCEKNNRCVSRDAGFILEE